MLLRVRGLPVLFVLVVVEGGEERLRIFSVLFFLLLLHLRQIRGVLFFLPLLSRVERIHIFIFLILTGAPSGLFVMFGLRAVTHCQCGGEQMVDERSGRRSRMRMSGVGEE